MGKGVVLLLIFILSVPIAYPISIKDLISRYIFSSSTYVMNVTSYTDFMIDKNNNGINDTLIFELTTSNSNGNFIFVLNLFDKNGILTNETNKTLGSGTNKLNVSFSSIFLTQPQFNYSIKIYNSTHSLKYRRDNILTQNYANYERGFEVIDIKDAKINKNLQVNTTINSSINGTFETALFLVYNNSIIFIKENKSLIDSLQTLTFDFGNETIKRTHFAGKFNISSLKIGKKTIKINSTTSLYNYVDFAATSYISSFTDGGVDTNGNNKYNNLQINASIQIFEGNDYSIILALYDLFDNVIEIKNKSTFLNSGRNTISLNFNGSKIYDKKLNGPYIAKNIELYENYKLVDKLNDAYTTGSYNYNDFDNPNLPDLIVNISVSDGYRYGINNITINFTFRNMGNKHAFNIFTDIFDNRTFLSSNKSNILSVGSIILYQINFTNISDFEITAIADLQDFVEELNESNNAKRFVIKLNKQPELASVANITVNETDDILINLSASDLNNDDVAYSINLSKFSNNSNIFKWNTKTTDSGNYTLKAVASDGFLSDSKIFMVIVLDVPEKDADNDGVNDSVDRLIGDEKSVNTSTINLTLFLGNSSNLSQSFNESLKVKFTDKNLTIVEFDLNFSEYKLNLTNLSIDKQLLNATGSLIVRGLKMPDGITKILYVDKINTTINGICVKDEEILSISEISSDCSSQNEFKVECDGTLQDSYKCTYNLTLDKYKVEGLKHSGIMQFNYEKPASQQSSTTSSSSSSASTGGGGGGVTCISKWKCSEWLQCIDGFKQRKCIDTMKCAFPTEKPVESEECTIDKDEKNEASDLDLLKIHQIGASVKKDFSPSIKMPSITGQAVKLIAKPDSFLYIFDFLSVVIVIAMVYLAAISTLSKTFK